MIIKIVFVIISFTSFLLGKLNLKSLFFNIFMKIANNIVKDIVNGKIKFENIRLISNLSKNNPKILSISLPKYLSASFSRRINIKAIGNPIAHPVIIDVNFLLSFSLNLI